MAVFSNSDIGFCIKQIHDRMEKRANNSLRADGLTMMQLSFLLELQRADEKQLTMKELERGFSVAQSTVAGIVSRLEQKGLVEARTDNSDKRVKLVHITPSGEACCAEAAVHKEESERKLLKGFTEAECETLRRLLMRAAKNME